MPKSVIIPAGSSAPLAPFVPGTLADGVVYVSGTLAFDQHNNVLFADDPKAQTRHVLETIRKVIETAGGTMADVTFNSIFITDWKNYAAINEIYAEFFPGDKPARFCIQCGLVKPDALALAHFQGKNNLLRRLNALKRADFSHHADRIRCPVQIICASDDLLVPTACSSELHAALPDSQKMVMRYGGHACNVTDPETFNALLLNGLASLLHHREAAL